MLPYWLSEFFSSLLERFFEDLESGLAKPPMSFVFVFAADGPCLSSLVLVKFF